MKLTANDKHFIMTPENETDCFELGHIGTFMGYTLVVTSNTDNPKPEINYMQIPLEALFDFIRTHTRKGGE